MAREALERLGYCIATRMTKKLNQNLPNIRKYNQNCSKNIKAQIESPKASSHNLLHVDTSTPNIDIESLQNRLLKVCYVPALSAGLSMVLFLLQPLTVLMKQTRKAVCAI